MRQVLGGSNMAADDCVCAAHLPKLSYDRGIRVYRHTYYDNSESLGASIFINPCFRTFTLLPPIFAYDRPA